MIIETEHYTYEIMADTIGIHALQRIVKFIKSGYDDFPFDIFIITETRKVNEYIAGVYDPVPAKEYVEIKIKRTRKQPPQPQHAKR